MPRHPVEAVCARSKQAWTVKDQWRNLHSQAYEFALPQRNPYAGSGDGLQKNQVPGQSKMDRVFDSTLIHATQRLANRLQSELCPPGREWAVLSPGALIADEQKEGARRLLAPIQRVMFGAIRTSNFDTACGEHMLELVTAGTAATLIEDGDVNAPVRYVCVPQSQVAFLEGPWGDIWAIFRKATIKARNVKAQWPEAKVPEKWEDESPQGEADKDIEVIEATYRGGREDAAWYYDVIVVDRAASKSGRVEGNRIVERRREICPWVVTRWIKASGEVQGRSPVMMALPDAKTLNKAKELMLRNAALQIGGIWLGRDDGVLNPYTVRFTPGTVIPVRATGGNAGASLSRLDMGGDLQLVQLVIADLQNSIRVVMMDGTLPPEQGPVRSATEIVARLRQLQMDIGAPFGRMIVEYVTPIIQGTLASLARQNLIPSRDGKPIRVDGGFVKVEITSPLAQSQHLSDIEAAVRWIDIMGSIDKRIAMLNAKVEDLGPWLGEKLNVDTRLIRSDEDRRGMQQMVGQMIGQGQQLPVGGGNGGIPVAGQSDSLPIAA